MEEQPINILIIANGIIGDDPSPSGGDVRFFMLARHWEKLGHKIHILSSEACQRLIENFGLNATLHILPWKKSNSSVVRLSFVARAWQAFWSIPESIQDFEGVVYTANDSLFDVLSGLKLKRLKGKRVAWSAIVHWMPPFPPWKRQQSSILNSTLFYLNERLCVFLANRYADAILPVSETTADQLQKAGVDMSKVYPVKCGVQYDYVRSIVESVKVKRFDAVFMKRIQGVKGAFDLVEIWRKVVAVKPDAQLVVIGDEGEDAAQVRCLLKKACIEENVFFTGFIYDSEEKFKILASARTFILPSYEENWAISLGEALCCGLPAIAYGLKELVHIWGDTTHWIPLGDTTAFARSILEYLQEDERVKSQCEKGLAFVQTLDWSVLAKDELGLLTQLAVD